MESRRSATLHEKYQGICIPQHSPSRVERIGVFVDYTELSTRARLTLSGACPRRNSSLGIIGPGVAKDLKLISDSDF
ncbi:hypothetical protein DPMN_122874 [Dreissena polymorpha]|uniref:Uncharacterized protein n=1 Tax=Dreissena polymorpha TaxID=45954 RepID=A0A9D4GTC5_DREPO|nr:hypothetical protein DPMN_122874 [Dreissena polymorpha]